MQRTYKLALAACSALALGTITLVAAPAGAATTVTPNGSWESYPGNSTTVSTTVQPPINADGSSNFKANGKSVIPVKFGLTSATGPFVFESIGSDTSTANDYSYVSFTPNSTFTFGDITSLSAQYAFTQGDCHGGALRWSVRTSESQALAIYYGTPPQFGNGGVQGCAGSNSQTGVNLINMSDLRYDTSQYAGGTFYDTYAHALTLLGSAPILRTSLVLDGGWAGDQRVTLSSATVKTSGFTDTFVPPAASTGTASVCPTDEATIKVTKTDGSVTGDINEPVSIQPQDNNGVFRIVDCKYMYNLATSSLSGSGTYRVYAVINGVQAESPARFDLK